MSLYNLALSDKEIETNLKIPIRSKVINKNNYEEKKRFRRRRLCPSAQVFE